MDEKSMLEKRKENLGTIVFSIHQPRYSIFKLFDRILLMCQGKAIYSGPSNELSTYLDSFPFLHDPLDNPADVALDMLSDTNGNPTVLSNLCNAHKNSAVFIELKKTLDNITLSQNYSKIYEKEKKYLVARPLITEIWYIAERTLMNSIRNPALFISQMIIALILGLLIGTVYYDMKRTIESGIPNRLGAIFLIIISQIFMSTSALEPLSKERALFLHVCLNRLLKRTSMIDHL